MAITMQGFAQLCILIELLTFAYYAQSLSAISDDVLGTTGETISFVVSARGFPPRRNGAPYVKVYARTDGAGNEMIGQTEILKGTNSPEFSKVFSYTWAKGRGQRWYFDVRGMHFIIADELLGQADLDVDNYVLQQNEEMTVNLSEGGTLTVQKVNSFGFSLFARNIPKLDAFNGLSEPYVECYFRTGKDGVDVLFHKTKVVKSENPDWDETILFKNYRPGTDQVCDKDVVGKDIVGQVVVEVDPFVQQRVALADLTLSSNNNATLTVIPSLETIKS